ncbi:MAG: sulfate ABC transporter substrate-binding protein [Terracoccus sp.]
MRHQPTRPARQASRVSRSRRALVAAALVLGLAACAGGSSDVVGVPVAADVGATTVLSLSAYAVPKLAFDALVPAFERTPAGRGTTVRQSYGASGDQSRKVAAGAPADVVAYSAEPDVTRLVDAGLVDPSWDAGPAHGVPYGSVVTIVVRNGNPRHITDWGDLLAPGVEVVTPNPFSSGSAKWNLLAPYAVASRGGADPAAGLAFVSALVSDHVRLQPKSGREATEAFLHGSGDALLSYENEALFLERDGEPVEHVTPAQTFRIDNPVAVLSGSAHRATARAFVDFLFTPTAQTLLAEAGFRPVDPGVAARFARRFPTPARLWTVADLGGWPRVDADLFAKDSGTIAAAYDRATQ